MIICCSASITRWKESKRRLPPSRLVHHLLSFDPKSVPTSNKRFDLILMCGSKNPEISPKWVSETRPISFMGGRRARGGWANRTPNAFVDIRYSVGTT
eukprot:scaffold19821_cov166-Skeletonema_marinoi.AAC.15